ncbi:MAG: hypothetical protein O3A00_29230, partial [Planctomycetota bacterium]|nr:hypothetical protein [Planctomycetota bacterium]
MKTTFAPTLGTAILLILAGTANCGTIVDDHFTGNSGGVPAAWSVVFGDGTSVESGTLLTITDSTSDPTVLSSSLFFDPQGTTTTITASISSLTAETGRSLSFGIIGSNNSIFLVGLGVDGNLRLSADPDAFNPPNSEELTLAASGIATSSIDITLVFDADSFQVTTSGGFDSTDTAFTFTNFTPSDLGTSVRGLIVNGGANDPSTQAT